jgi:hypothetical protein
MPSPVLIVVSDLAAARHDLVAFPTDNAALGAIANTYAVRSFSVAFDLDQQCMG